MNRITIDRDRRDIYVDGRKIKPLPPKEYDILLTLADGNGRVITRAELLDLSWGKGHGMKVDSRTIDQHIGRLRKNLGSGASCIITRTNAGYQAINVGFLRKETIYGVVSEIERHFDPKPGARVTLDVSGDVLQELKKGQKILVA